MKAARLAVRIADLADPDHLRRMVRRLIGGPVGQRLRAGGVEPGDPERIAAEAQDQGRRLAPFVADTTTLLNRWMDEGQSVLFEGAQGTMLDIDHGSFPYVTSSNTVAGGLCTGLGVAPTRVDGIVGVFKAYTTRVGLGPMPTELEDGPDGFGQRIRTRGREYGTTTGRPRRCGWFDGAAAAWANRINRFDAVCVMLLDVLDEFDEIRVGTGYRLDGQRIDAMPACIARAARVEAAYESCRGWRTDTTGISRWEDLPSRAIEYVDFLGSVVGAEPALVSVGPDRAQTLLRPESWLVRTIGL
jgi:adenylosuccinate synthase